MDIKIVVRVEPGMVTEESKALEELVAAIKAEGRSITVQNNWGTAEPPRGLSTFEEILIFIGSGASTALLNAVVTDAYNAAKNWGRKRFGDQHRKVDAPVVDFRIYGPDDERLVWWWIDAKGETDHDYRYDFDVIIEAVGRNKIQVMKGLPTLFRVNIDKAKQIVETAPPIVLIEQVTEKRADEVKATSAQQLRFASHRQLARERFGQ